MSIETMKQMVDALMDFDYDKRMAAIEVGRQAIEQEKKQELNAEQFDHQKAAHNGLREAMNRSQEIAKAAQPKAEQEPVAWMKEGWGPDCGPYIEFYREDEMGWRDRKEWTPLYTHPQPKADQEPVAVVVARKYDDGSHAGHELKWSGRNEANDFPEGTKLYTSPQPQKPWVGLTDEEIKEIIGPWGDTPIKGYTRKLFDAIEAKLKEKNA